MKSKIISCILCAALIFTSLPSGITVNASETATVAADTEDEENIEVVESEEVKEESEQDIIEEKTEETVIGTEIADKDSEGESASETITESDTESSGTNEIKETVVDDEETTTQGGETETEISETETTVITEVLMAETEITEEETSEIGTSEEETTDITETETETEKVTDTDISLLSDDGDIASGTYKNVTWVIDADGKLTISGTGNFKQISKKIPIDAPWYDYRESIKTAVVNIKLSSKTTDVSYMFHDCNALTSVVFEEFDMSRVSDMSYMFSGCSSLTTLDLSSFNPSRVSDMSHMFDGCSSLTTLDLSSFNPSVVSDMSHMFDGCSSLTTLDLSSFSPTSIRDMSYVFYGCSSLTTLDLSNFGPTKVTNVSYMFYDCSSLTTLDLSRFNIQYSNRCSNNEMLEGATSLRKIYTPRNLIGTNTIYLPDYHYDENGNKIDDKWYMPDGTEITKLPNKLSYSVVIEKNAVPETTEKAYIKATKNRTTYSQGSTLTTSDIIVQYFGTDGKITTLSKGYTTNASEIDMTTAGVKNLKVTYNDNGTDLSTDIAITVTERAVSEEVKYVVTFELNGGTSTADSTQTVTGGENAERPANPTYEGKTFRGWYSDSALTTSYNFSDPVTADITLYAKWDGITTGFAYMFDETRTDSLTKTYTGSAITPAVVVEYNGKALVKDVDYTVTYKNNVNASESAKVIIKGKGSYSGKSGELPFTIKPVDLNSSDVICPSTISVVSGQKVGKFTITYNGKTLNNGKDYKIARYEGSDDDNGKFTDDGYIFIEGVTNGNFTTKDETYREIYVSTVESKSDLKYFDVSLNPSSSPKTYKGSEIKLEFLEDYVVKDKSSGEALYEDEEYIVTYSNNNKVGTASVTFTGIGEYTGNTVKKTFKIVAPKLDKITDTLNIKNPATGAEFDYDPSGVRLSSDDLRITCGNRTLFENVDYKVSYKNNKKASKNSKKASYTITFMGDFKGYPTLKGDDYTFVIKQATFGDKVNVKAVSLDKVVNKSGAYKSAPVVTYMGTKVATNEYKVKYYYDDGKTEITGNKISVGNDDSKTVIVMIVSTGKNFVKDNNNTEYEVCRYTVWNSAAEGKTDISKAKVSINNGKAKQPCTGIDIELKAEDITITLKNGEEITGDELDKNFELDYYNNKNIGKATVVIKAKEGSAYIGSKTATFQITS